MIVAALIAVAGTALVVLYVKGADDRAIESQAPVQVLKATAQINPGETAAQARDAGKFKLEDVPRSQLLPGALNDVEGVANQVALATIYPGEQVITGKFGAPGTQTNLNIPDGKMAMSLSLSDTGRVAGFVDPGSSVAVMTSCNGRTQTMFPKMEVIAVGMETMTTMTTTDASGNQVTEQLPRTLFTLAVSQEEGQQLLATMSTCELAFALLRDNSIVDANLPPADAAAFLR